MRYDLHLRVSLFLLIGAGLLLAGGMGVYWLRLPRWWGAAPLGCVVGAAVLRSVGQHAWAWACRPRLLSGGRSAAQTAAERRRQR